MKYVDEYRDPEATRALAGRHPLAGHAAVDAHGGLRRPDPRHREVRHRRAAAAEMTLLHGPGCPVCVTPVEMIDTAIELASPPGGDLLLVRGHAARARDRRGTCSRSRPPAATCASSTRRSMRVRSRGTIPTARSCSSPSGSRRPRPPTRWPSTRRRRDGVGNFSDAGVARARASRAGGDPRVAGLPRAGVPRGRTRLRRDGLPRSIVRSPLRHRVPIVVTGFEPLDILQGIYLCVRQLEEGRAEVENQYARVVAAQGNRPAQALMTEVFEVVDRQLARHRRRSAGAVSGCRPAYAALDAERRFDWSRDGADEQPTECQSGRVLQGLLQPHRVSGLRDPVHARAPTGRHHGVVRGGVRRLLPAIEADA